MTASARRTTVLMPLHRAAPWRERVLDTVQQLLPVARVVLSDATEQDDTLDWLAERLSHRPDRAAIELIGARPLGAGWVEHANDLQRSVTTEFCMWLPQDDRVGPDWILGGEHALDARLDAVLAVGSLQLESDADDSVVELLPPVGEYAVSSAVDRVRSALRRQFFTGPPGLGHAFRGVQRASARIPLPTVTIDGIDPAWGWKADVLWAIGLLSRGAFAPVDAVYRKTVHAASASHRWPSENLTAGFRRLLVEQLTGLTDAQRLALVSDLWDDEASRLRRRVRTLEQREAEGSDGTTTG